MIQTYYIIIVIRLDDAIIYLTIRQGAHSFLHRIINRCILFIIGAVVHTAGQEVLVNSLCQGGNILIGRIGGSLNLIQQFLALLLQAGLLLIGQVRSIAIIVRARQLDTGVGNSGLSCLLIRDLPVCILHHRILHQGLVGIELHHLLYILLRGPNLIHGIRIALHNSLGRTLNLFLILVRNRYIIFRGMLAQKNHFHNIILDIILKLFSVGTAVHRRIPHAAALGYHAIALHHVKGLRLLITQDKISSSQADFFLANHQSSGCSVHLAAAACQSCCCHSQG